MDEWALGVLLFYMFSGSDYPSCQDNKVKFTAKVWSKYLHSKAIRQLVRALLNLDEARRMTVSKALQKSSLFAF